MNANSQNTPQNLETELSLNIPNQKKDDQVENRETNGELSSLPANLERNSAVEKANFDDELENMEVESQFQLELPENLIPSNIQVQLKSEDGKLLLILPTEREIPSSELYWNEIWQQMKQRLNASDRLRQTDTPLYLIAKDRLLDSRQLQELEETLSTYQLQLKSVTTSRRQTAIAACTLGYSVEQTQLQTALNFDLPVTTPALADPLYLEMTIRSGVEIRHPGTVIILGDVNPGGIVVADGDILVWGRLRGVAHAGANGNNNCLIMSLQMEATQLRIADTIARLPETPPSQYLPEVAYITTTGINIVKANEFSRSQISQIKV
ncbi:septum site-determining protein MinC [Anabaena sp. FACHB-1237]|uniref:septum site-determining protein MinC n=1 Tax=Anabaena sp. FACHB-1237 TaxID=2692769 RepID=UPI001680F412|nr:septum site-determining protein MinC [Anabaena sp. FACHB-1237]MBD2137160.1 septum site-determining protein MinC [Anabaena sp. FACHB-1237]